jgi:hypothetical protein
VVVELGIEAGWRKENLTSTLKVRHVRLAEHIIRVEPNETKNGKGMEHPMSADLVTLMTPLVVGRESSEPLFKVVQYDSRKAWKRIFTAAGFPTRVTKKGNVVSTLLIHDWRRTSARLKTRAGVTPKVAQKSGGWETSSAFDRYNIVVTDDLVDAVAKQKAYEQQVRETAAALAKQMVAQQALQNNNGPAVAAARPLRDISVTNALPN